MNNLQIYITKNHLEGTVDIILYSENEINGNRKIFNYDTEGQCVVNTEYEYGKAAVSQAKPFLKLNRSMFELLVNGIQEFADRNNIVSNKQTLIEGKLEIAERELQFIKDNLVKFIDKSTK